jgi:hypothetical protein
VRNDDVKTSQVGRVDKAIPPMGTFFGHGNYAGKLQTDLSLADIPRCSGFGPCHLAIASFLRGVTYAECRVGSTMFIGSVR